jgi:hypothetical protein
MAVLSKSRVQELFDKYQNDKQTKPNMYRLANGGVNYTLPEDLCWTWANRCAGDSGGTNPRPVGIRLEPNKVKDIYGDQNKAMKQIFSSVSSLYNFIVSSDCGGAEHLAKKIMKKATNQVTSISAGFLELELLKLAIETKDSELARMVIKGDATRFQKMVDKMSADLL